MSANAFLSSLPSFVWQSIQLHWQATALIVITSSVPVILMRAVAGTFQGHILNSVNQARKSSRPAAVCFEKRVGETTSALPMQCYYYKQLINYICGLCVTFIG